ncbi:toxin biosynthesis cytochrome P450 monooxygenase [Exophiala viscosa]|uniref:toxin biosynthesis cytochrome P450 monooxygenase n=1 Tax=Exophiala viscosa TaxID=2486360 RepID=UPI00219957C1|nr:toxin biosynthesis cytochrome P450 monooxygenase [Exophiala viscosa]
MATPWESLWLNPYGSLTLATAGVSVLCPISFLLMIIYNIYFHQLRSFPGPKSYAASRIPYLRQILAGTLHSDLRRLHEEYGSVVRIAPNDLSFKDTDAWEGIYGFRPGVPEWQKDRKFYVRSFGKTHSIIQADTVGHRRARKLFQYGFSEQVLKKQERYMTVYIDLLIERMRAKAQQMASVNLVNWYNFMSFDLIGDLVFGEPFGCLADSDYHPWVAMIFRYIKSAAYTNALLRMPGGEAVFNFLMKYGMPKKMLAARNDHYNLTKNKVEKRMATVNDRADFIGYIQTAQNTEKGLSEEEIIANACDFIVAGSETTATVLSAASYFLCRNSHAMEKLQEEIRGTFDKEEEIILSSVNTLPYLLAVLNETLRMHPPVPSGLPRIVSEPGGIISGRHVPVGISVSVSPMATYRDPKHFRDPDSFRPERFLGEPYFADDQRAALQPFAVGPRNCIGKSLALAEMRLTLARMIWNFDFDLDSKCESWTDQQAFLLWMKPPLWLKLTALEKR